MYLPVPNPAQSLKESVEKLPVNLEKEEGVVRVQKVVHVEGVKLFHVKRVPSGLIGLSGRG